LILASEIAKDPALRKEIRKAFKFYGAVTVRPTDKGAQKIDEMHPYYTFKYLQEKPVDEFKGQGQFLQILDAEAEGLVDINIHVQKEPLRNLTLEFYKVYLTSMDSEEAKATVFVKILSSKH